MTDPRRRTCIAVLTGGGQRSSEALNGPHLGEEGFCLQFRLLGLESHQAI